MEFRILGSFEVLGVDGVLDLRGAKRRELLACLVVHAGEPMSTDRLVEELWGDGGSNGAARTVQTYVSQLRKLLRGKGPCLQTRPGGYVLEVDAAAVDAHRFRQGMTIAGTETDPARRLTVLDEALGLWRGAPLVEFAGAGWAEREARRLEALQLEALHHRCDTLLELDRPADAVAELEDLVAAHPLEERFWAQLMLALYRTGRQADALSAYQRARRHLVDEMGIEPGPELVDLEHRILGHDPTLVVRSEPQRTAMGRGPVVTFLFTDMEESTRLWADFPDAMPGALERHDALLDEAVEGHAGTVAKRTGDGVLAVFSEASGALQAALHAQLAFADTVWATTPPVRARMAIHVGPALERGGDYFGMSLNMAARLRDAGHGGQILLSAAAARTIGEHLPRDVGLAPLGAHRLRGIPGDHHLYQVLHPRLPERFPPLRTLDAAAAVAVPATSFYGRADELAKLSALVTRPGTVTLVGPGGVGKTRLAVELAAEAGHRFRDGVRMIDLAPIGADAVPAAVAAGLGLVRRGRRSFRDSILEWVGRKHMLLVGDNCEHVLGVVGPLIREIAETSGEVTVLCTSRQPMGFLGEVIFPVEPLGLPPADNAGELDSFPAVRLFADRAAAAGLGVQVEPEQLEVVAQICRRLDGIPLAVELAAARARSIGLHDLLAHLHSASPLLATPTPDHPRHRSLLSTIHWSYDLLTPESRLLFDRLSVFSASWTVGAALTVCGEEQDEQDVLSILANLADRSMIVADLGPLETRYRMLSTLRDFAAHRLADAGDTAERRSRHAAFYAELAEAAEPGLRTGEEARWARLLAADFDNLHATHLWAIENADVDLDARLLVALWNYGLQRLSAEYFRWVEDAFDTLSFDDHPLLPDLHGIAALGAWLRGDMRQCLRSCQSAFEAEQALGCGVTLPARMAMILATAYAPRIGDPALGPLSAEAPGRFLEVVERTRALGDPYWLAYSMTTGSLGMVLSGEPDHAAAVAGRALQTARQSGSPTAVAYALFSVAAALEQSQPERSEVLLNDSVGAARDVESPLVLGLSLSRLATLRRRLGRPPEAIPLLLELLDHWDRLGDLPQLWYTVRESAMCLGLLGADQTAVSLLASVGRAELVMPPLPADRAHAPELADQLRDRLGDDAYAEADRAGGELTREEAVALAARTLVRTRDTSSQPR